MQIASARLANGWRLAGKTPALSKEVQPEIEVDGTMISPTAGNGRLTCRHFDIHPQTFYRWKRRYDPRRL